MQLSIEVIWSFYDFVVMGTILFSFGIIVNLIFYKIKGLQKKLIITSIIITLFFLLWAELAVGIFNSPLSGS